MQPNRLVRLLRETQGQRSEAERGAALHLVRLWIGIAAVRGGETEGKRLRDSVSLRHGTTAITADERGEGSGRNRGPINCMSDLTPLLHNDVCRDVQAPCWMEPAIAGRSIRANDRRPQRCAVRESSVVEGGVLNHLTAKRERKSKRRFLPDVAEPSLSCDISAAAGTAPQASASSALSQIDAKHLVGGRSGTLPRGCELLWG